MPCSTEGTKNTTKKTIADRPLQKAFSSYNAKTLSLQKTKTTIL
jgi:hypothetical protein